MKHNLFSARKLGSQGCEIKFELDRWKVKKGALVIAQGGKMGSLYVVENHSKVGVIHPGPISRDGMEEGEVCSKMKSLEFKKLGIQEKVKET